jgi:hypothetical protein
MKKMGVTIILMLILITPLTTFATVVKIQSGVPNDVKVKLTVLYPQVCAVLGIATPILELKVVVFKNDQDYTAAITKGTLPYGAYDPVTNILYLSKEHITDNVIVYALARVICCRHIGLSLPVKSQEILAEYCEACIASGLINSTQTPIDSN